MQSRTSRLRVLFLAFAISMFVCSTLLIARLVCPHLSNLNFPVSVLSNVVYIYFLKCLLGAHEPYGSKGVGGPGQSHFEKPCNETRLIQLTTVVSKTQCTISQKVYSTPLLPCKSLSNTKIHACHVSISPR